METPNNTPRQALKAFWDIYGPTILQGLACLAFYALGLALLFMGLCL